MNQKNWPDLAGRIDGRTHVLPVRVYFEDTDFTGLVYHANYLKFCERGRSDFVRSLGVSHKELFSSEDGSEQSAFAIAHLEIDYLRPAHIDDVLEVVSSVGEMGKATLIIHQEVRREETILARLSVKVVLVNSRGRPMRISALMQEAFRNFVSSKKDGS